MGRLSSVDLAVLALALLLGTSALFALWSDRRHAELKAVLDDIEVHPVRSIAKSEWLRSELHAKIEDYEGWFSKYDRMKPMIRRLARKDVSGLIEWESSLGVPLSADINSSLAASTEPVVYLRPSDDEGGDVTERSGSSGAWHIIATYALGAVSQPGVDLLYLDIDEGSHGGPGFYGWADYVMPYPLNCFAYHSGEQVSIDLCEGGRPVVPAERT